MSWPPASDLKLEIAWGDTPNTYPRNWTDVTAYLRGRYWKLSTRRGRSFVLDQIQAGTMTVTLDNADGRFTPENSAGAYYPNVVTDVPIRAHTTRTLAADTFTRANTPEFTGFQLGTAETGGAWSGSVGNSPTLAPQWYIDTNTARMGGYTGVFHDDAYATLAAGAADVEVQVTFAGSPAKHQGLVFRFASATSFYKLRTRTDYAAYEVISFLGGHGSDTVIYTVPGVTPTAGDVLKVVLEGANGEVFINGTSRGTFTMASNLTATRHGLGHVNNFGNRDIPIFDNFSIIDNGPLFEGYIQSYDPEWPEDDPEGICTIEAVDGLAPLAGDALVTPGYADAFDRPDGQPIDRADTGQTWHADGGTWETWDNAAQCVRLAGLNETFEPGTRPTYIGDTSLETNHTNLLGTAPTLQVWTTVTGGNWLIAGPASGSLDYAFVADWLNYRSFYEDPATNGDGAGHFRVGITPTERITAYTARLTLGDTSTADATGSMMGIFFLGSGTSYWAFFLEDRTPSGTLGYGCTLVKVDAGTATYYRTYGDIYPTSPNNPAWLSSFYFGGLPFATDTVDVTVSLVGGNIRVELTPIQVTTPRPEYTVRVADKPAGGFLPGVECGLIHNGVSRVDSTDHTTKVNLYRWDNLRATGRGILWLETSLSDAIVQARIKLNDSRLAYNADFSGKGLVFRYSDDQNYWFAVLSTDGAGSPFYLRLYKVVAGATTLVGTAYFGFFPDAIASGEYSLDLTTNILRVVLAGDEIQIQWRGVNRLTAADSFNQSATKYGLYHGNAIFSTDLQDEEEWDSSLLLRNHDDFRLGRELDTQYTGERVDALLDLVGWPQDLRQIATGTVLIAPKEVDILAPDFDLSILGEIQNAVDTELGLFFIRADGVAVFEDRNTRLDSAHSTSRGTFGNGGGSTISCLVLKPSMDNTRIANVIGIERTAFDIDEVQTITLTGATGGTWTITYKGIYTTAAIDFDATAAEVQTALVALGPIINGDVSVTGDDGGPYAIRFRENLGNQDIDLMQVDGSALTGTSPTIEIVETTKGGSSEDQPATAMAQDATSISLHRRRPLSKTTLLTNDEDAQTLANLLLNRWKSDHMRIVSLALDWANTEEYAKARKLEISDLINVTYSPPSTPSYTFAQASFIEGVAHEISQESAVTNWSVSPAALSASFWILESAAFGVLEVTTIPA